MPTSQTVVHTGPLVQGYEVVIGFETHAQLTTVSKMFSRATNAFGGEPNTQASAVDMALPGTLPVPNRMAVERAMQFGLAVGAKIAPVSVFARKNYFYPDLPKGYQISQFEQPVVQGGEVAFMLGQEARSVRLVRAHLEEDAGKSMHDDFEHGNAALSGMRVSGIDLNRAGTPLLEIVTEPDMRSSEEAVAYARALHGLVMWLGICDGNMQEGNFRCDANVSVRRPGQPLGARREIKNLNSFRFLRQAIDYEVHWQIDELESGRNIVQATVLFDPASGATRATRNKEDSADYRYFPDPDLPPLKIDAAWIARVQAMMPELPAAMAKRFVQDYAVPHYDASQLTQSRALAGYFESAAQASGQAKLASNWVMSEVQKRLNQDELGISAAPVSAATLAVLLQRIADTSLSHTAARQVFDALWLKEGDDVDAIIAAKGLRQVNDSAALDVILDEVLGGHAKVAAEVQAGNVKALNALVGLAMKASKGKANPAQVSAALRARLGV